MRTVEQIFQEQNPQDGTVPEWAKKLAIEYAKEAIKADRGNISNHAKMIGLEINHKPKGSEDNMIVTAGEVDKASIINAPNIELK